MTTYRSPAPIALAVAGLLGACGVPGARGPREEVSSSPAFAVTPVAAYGRLQVCGSRICGAAGQPVQLRGMSFFWSNTGWGGERFMNATAVGNLADGWNATVVRAPLGVEGSGGYLESAAAAAANLARVRAVIDGAVAAGVYVIVDWHYSSSAVYQAQAQAVFKELAQQYASVPNVIWEPYNEPTSNSWASLKSYHEAIISTIRAAGSPNLVVVGSPTWSQDVDVAAADPITSDGNVAYSLHFYAGTHGQSLRDKANAAMSKGRAVFVTEYGTCDASGNGNFNPTEAKAWTDWMDLHLISSANWSLDDKAETASALAPGASATGPWPDGQLTQSGLWVKPYVGAGYGGTTPGYSLAVTKAGTGAGTVTSTPAGVSCGSACSASFASGTPVTLSAAPASGSTFAGWGGACTGTGTCTVTMSQAQAVRATFDLAGTAAGCRVVYSVVNQWPGGFQAGLAIHNTGTSPWTGWTVSWTFPGDQRIGQLWNGSYVQSGAAVAVTNLGYNGAVPAGGAVGGAVGFTGTFSGTNAAPARFSVNGVACD